MSTMYPWETPKSVALLHEFVEFVWEDKLSEHSLQQDIHARRWLLTEGADVYGKYWFFKELLKAPCVSKCLLQKNTTMKKKGNNDPLYYEDLQITVQIRLIYKLRYLLPVLKNCKDMRNVNYTDDEGQTVLHVFFRHYVPDSLSTTSVNFVKRLIELGVSIDTMDKQRNTPLHVAFKRDDNLICQSVNVTPSLLVSDFTGQSIRQPDCSEILRLLVPRNYDVNTRDNDGYTLLHYAVKNGAIGVVSELLQLGADVHCRTKVKGLTPLHLIPTEKFHRPYKRTHSYGDYYSNDIELLLAAGADIDAEATDGVTPLFEMVARGNVEDLRYMMEERGADILRSDKVFGFTPFHLAVHEIEKFQLMLERISTDVHRPTNRGITPLHVASILGNIDVVKLLIERGADVNCRTDKYKLTPLHVAVMDEDGIPRLESIFGAIGKSQVEISSIYELWNCLTFNDADRTDLIELLMNSGADKNAKDIFGRTPLFLATRYYNSYATAALAKLDVDLDVEDNRGRLPLHNVINNQDVMGFKQLLKYGVNINDADLDDDDIIEGDDDIKKIALKFATKLQAANLPIAQVYELHLDEQVYGYHFGKCLAEIDQLKAHKINDTFSLYDLLHVNSRSQYLLSKRKLLPADFSTEFPLYCGIVRAIYNESNKKLSLMEQAKFAWYQTTRIYLPDICVEHILSYFSSRHMKVLITGKKM